MIVLTIIASITVVTMNILLIRSLLIVIMILKQ